jgi:hypothetical protein
MQGNLDPISPYGRAFLGGVQGASPDQVAQRAAEVDKAGLIPFADAIRIKQMADQLSKSGAGMNQPPQGTVLDSLRGQIQSALGPQQMAPQQMPPQDQYAGLRALPVPDDMYADVGMAGGGIVAFQEGGLSRGPYAPPQRMPYDAPVGAAFEDELLRRIREADGVRPPPSEYAPTGDRGSLSGLFSALTGPAPSAPAAAPAPTVAAVARPPVEGLGGKPFAAPSPALRAAPPAQLGPVAPTGIAALISKPEQKDFQEEAAKSYSGLRDALRRQDDLLKERGASLEERFDAQSKLLLAMTGFQMAAEASKPGATFLGSAGAAGAEYAKSRMAANEKFADRVDRLADSRAELDVAKAQLEVTQSDKAYERYNSAYERYSKDQDRVQRMQEAAADRADRRDIYGTEIEKTRLARGISDIDEAIFSLPEDDPRRQELEARRDSLIGTYQILEGSSGSSDLAIARIKMQAKTALRNSEPYKTLSGQIQMLEAQYNDNPTVELSKKLADARNKLRAMEQKAQDEALSILSGGSMFGTGDLTGEGDISAVDAEAEVGF